jgi:hypothetical protein
MPGQRRREVGRPRRPRLLAARAHARRSSQRAATPPDISQLSPRTRGAIRPSPEPDFFSDLSHLCPSGRRLNPDGSNPEPPPGRPTVPPRPGPDRRGRRERTPRDGGRAPVDDARRDAGRGKPRRAPGPRRDQRPGAGERRSLLSDLTASVAGRPPSARASEAARGPRPRRGDPGSSLCPGMIRGRMTHKRFASTGPGFRCARVKKTTWRRGTIALRNEGSPPQLGPTALRAPAQGVASLMSGKAHASVRLDSRILRRGHD